MISPYALLMYVMFAFSIVVTVFATGRYQSIGQNSKMVMLTKLIIVVAIILAFIAVFESVFMIWSYSH